MRDLLDQWKSTGIEWSEMLKKAHDLESEIVSLNERIEMLSECDSNLEETIKARHKRRSLRGDVAMAYHRARIEQVQMKSIELRMKHNESV